jgi:hypothetical protein
MVVGQSVVAHPTVVGLFEVLHPPQFVVLHLLVVGQSVAVHLMVVGLFEVLHPPQFVALHLLVVEQSVAAHRMVAGVFGAIRQPFRFLTSNELELVEMVLLPKTLWSPSLELL